MRKVVAFSGLIVAFFIAIQYIGVYFSAPVFVGASLRVIGRVKWLTTVIFALIVGLLLPFIFYELLELQSPRTQLL